MTHEGSELSEEDLKQLKQYWYNRWKEGFSWLDMANTLKTSADTIHEELLAADQRFIQNIWKNSEVKQDEEGIKVRTKGDILSYGDSEMGLYPMYMSQVGYALENLFKGIIICGMWLDNPKSIDGLNDFQALFFPIKGNTTQRPITIKTHDLIALLTAKDISLKFGEEKKKVLIKLIDFILWGGRYPVPLKLDTGDPIFMRVMAPYDEPEEHEMIEKIYQTAKTELARLSALQRDRRPD